MVDEIKVIARIDPGAGVLSDIEILQQWALLSCVAASGPTSSAV